MRRLTELLKRFRRDENGAFLVIFGILAVVLIAMSGAVVDFTYMQTARSRAQTALDSAALAMQSKINDVNAGTITKAAAQTDIKAKAQKIVEERLNDGAIVATVNTATIDLTNGKLALQASIKVPTAFIQLVGIKDITAQLSAEATRGSSDIEVSIALDTTGSMGMDSSFNPDPTKINALIASTNKLIDNVVNTVQTPTYSKMALVPYSYGVNVGATYANSVRGTLTTVTGSITGADWAAGASQTVGAVTAINNGKVTITIASHGLNTGDTVYIQAMEATGSKTATITDLNDHAYVITRVDANNFTLNGVTGASGKSGTNNKGKTTKCTYTNCDVHLAGSFGSFKNGDGVYLTGVTTGETNLNNTGYFITYTNSSNIMLRNANALGVKGQNTTGANGTLTRANYGDIYYHFNTWAGGENTFASTYCVTERTGAEAYTDAAPSTVLLHPLYPSDPANCVSQTIVPLSSNRTTLHNTVNALTAAGSTAGHIGLAWAWYMVAPKFAYLWPGASQPAAYKRANLLKAVILMTDGQFNTQYCNSVIAQDSQNIDGASNMINCNGTNGLSQAQAQAICTQIKDPANGILLYTVGFDIGSTATADVNARAFLSACATDPTYFYQADDGTDLDNAFQQIAQKLNALRLSH